MRVLLCGYDFGPIQTVLERSFASHEVLLCHRQDVAKTARQAEVIVPVGARIGREELEGTPVRLVQQLGAGLETIDIDTASQLGVYVANVPSDLTANAQGVAEIALAHMLVLGRNLRAQHERVVSGKWHAELHHTLASSAVALVGYGAIGRALGRLLGAFGCTLRAVSRRGPKAEAEPNLAFHGTLEDLPAVLAQSDFVVIAVPLNDETRGLIGKRLLEAMKPGAFLINVARGGVIDHDALCEALASGHLGGAGFDVYWREPLPADDPILQYNVVCSPHIGGSSFENIEGMAKEMAENFDRVQRGEPPNHCVNLDQIAERDKL